MKNSRKDKIAAFGSHMPRIVAEIGKSKKFRYPPVGPIGAYINVTEGTPENIARAKRLNLLG